MSLSAFLKENALPVAHETMVVSKTVCKRERSAGSVGDSGNQRYGGTRQFGRAAPSGYRFPASVGNIRRRLILTPTC